MNKNSKTDSGRGYRNFKSYCFALIFLMSGAALFSQSVAAQDRVFRAGAAKSNITPKIGTSMNGSMQDKTIRNVHDDTYARGFSA